MRLLAAIAILGALGSPAQARVHHHHRPVRQALRPLAIPLAPPPFGDRYAVYIPLGRYQLGSAYHTLCGFTLVTDCAQESPYGP